MSPKPAPKTVRRRSVFCRTLVYLPGRKTPDFDHIGDLLMHPDDPRYQFLVDFSALSLTKNTDLGRSVVEYRLKRKAGPEWIKAVEDWYASGEVEP